ncbi:MAG: DNA gyrase/topoisomerase IV subunit A [Bacteroidetes bacterium]|nr:DNA gyrase/topoisomerase IV subunit A [Bacteroidota bacterium]
MAKKKTDKNEEEEEGKSQDITPMPVKTGVTHVSGMYKDWFLDYASYVILERAVPDIRDGVKPVQRRILHAMREMDDGRFHKVANVIGQTMQYHPHGDAAIGDALVNIGQKDLLIETQGNWGDVRTGDDAAAPRYIEARLSKFALEVVFNKETTEWQLSYDGRKAEPVFLPVKFPLVLAMGVEGIAVGLSTKILTHNFCELILASIEVLKGNPTKILPDFANGGYIDVSDYNSGERGSKIRCRAKMEVADKKTILIKEIPYGTTTSSLIDSIIKANDKGKIKIKKVTDNTAKDVEIAIELAAGVSPDVTVDALYAFTDCEISISPSTCVIEDDTPLFLTVDEILRRSTKNTKNLLKLELELRLEELNEKWHFSSLEKIFIENRIYRDIEECETWEAVIKTIDKGLDPYKKLLVREVTEDDIVRLTEIKIKRISKFDAFKADEYIRALENEMKEVKHNLRHLTDYAIKYFEDLLKKYGKGRERKSEIRKFDTIEAKAVVANNAKLYVNREEGFVGFGLKKDEFICDCSDIDDIIAFTDEGKMKVVRIADKVFIGKKIVYAAVWKKEDERMTYHMIYSDSKSGKAFAKRFNVTAITRDKEYDLTQGNPKSKVWYFSANPNSESEVVNIQLHPNAKAKIKIFDFDFGELAVKGRSSMGNTITKYGLRKVVQKEKGTSTLGGRKLWLDETVGRLNIDSRGRYLGEFDTGDNILVIYRDGNYELTNFELSNRFEMRDVMLVEKFNENDVISAAYWDNASKNMYVKRFYIEAIVPDKKYPFISETPGSKLYYATNHPFPVLELILVKGRKGEEVTELIEVADFIDIKGWKSQGNRLSQYEIKKVTGKKGETEETTEEETPSKKKTDVKVGTQMEWDLDKKAKDKGEQTKLF